MLKGALALVFRYVLLLGGSGLATAGIITATGNSHFCFDARVVADAAATAVAMMLGPAAAAFVAGIVAVALVSAATTITMQASGLWMGWRW